MERHLRPWQRVAGRAAMYAARLAKRVLPTAVTGRFSAVFHNLGIRQFIGWDAPRVRGDYETLLDVFERPPLRKTAV
jgi:hypothetical protein